MLKKISLPLLDIESKVDKNNNPYFKLSLTNSPGSYFYAFSDLPKETLTLLKEVPHKLVGKLVLISYETKLDCEELSNSGFLKKHKVKEIKFLGS